MTELRAKRNLKLSTGFRHTICIEILIGTGVTFKLLTDVKTIIRVRTKLFIIQNRIVTYASHDEQF